LCFILYRNSPKSVVSYVDTQCNSLCNTINKRHHRLWGIPKYNKMKRKQHFQSQWYRTFFLMLILNVILNIIPYVNTTTAVTLRILFFGSNPGIPQSQWCCLLILKVLYDMYTKVLTFETFLFFLLYRNSPKSVVSYSITQFHSQSDTIYVITTTSLCM